MRHMPRPIACAILIVVLSLAGCAQQEGARPGPDEDDGDGGAIGPVQEEINVIEQGQQSSIREAETVVITTQEDWEVFWQRHKSDGGGAIGEEPSSPPEVDFTTHRVIAVMAGQKPDACHAVRIVEAVTQGGTTQVNVVLYTPPPDVMCAEVITYPYAIATLGVLDTEVTFNLEDEEGLPPDEEDVPELEAPSGTDTPGIPDWSR